MITVPEKDGELALKLLPKMAQMTWDRFGRLWLDNAAANMARLEHGQSIAKLRNEPIGDGDSTIIIAAGPSVKRRNPADRIKRSSYKGALIVTESALSYCLRNAVVPDLTVTLDPHHTRVVRWFGDPDLTEEKLALDDYHSRQDQDDAFADEMRANDEILELLNRHGKDIRIALSTSASKPVVDRVIETGMQIYWWNPMIDDPDAPGSKTAELQKQNGLPCINSGGNVGSASWMIADAVLGKKHVALTGIDFSYYDGTPYRNTQYFYEGVNLVGEENLDALFIRIHNPFVDAWFFTDPAYLWYRESFLEMAADAECRTYNCTEGGILFGENISVIPLAEFLDRFS